jgi:glycosyltransferase involved in cell wall biosynthesis
LEAEDGVNILLAEQPARFVAAISGLLRDSNDRQRLGTNGRQTFERLYTWEGAWRGLDRDLQVKWPVELNRYTG